MFLLKSPRRDLLATAPYTACITWHKYKSRPWGLNGGKQPKVGNYSIIYHGTGKEMVHSRTGEHLDAGDMCSNLTNGGGGFGDPLERDPKLVREDVIDGYVSIKGARENYGVVIDPQTLNVDFEATKRLRKEESPQK